MQLRSPRRLLAFRAFLLAALLPLAACSSTGPPKPCEADSDCPRGAVCLRESPLVAPSDFARQNGRDPGTFCKAVLANPAIPRAADGKLYVGAAKIDVTPRGFETHNNIDDAGRCPNNKPWVFEGYLDAPRGKDDPRGDPNNPCLETFNDTNQNGYYDAVWMGGFDNARAAQGVDEEVPIMARVMVASRNGEYFALVALDFIGLVPPQQDELRKILHTELGLDRNRVLLHVTHNHEGPDVQGIWGPTVVNSSTDVAKAIVEIASGDLGTFSAIPIRPGVSDAYWPFVEAKVVAAAREALSKMKPARLKIAGVPAPMRSRPVVVGGTTLNVDDVVFDRENLELPDFNGDGVRNDPSDLGSFIGGGAGRLLMTDLKLPHLMDPLVAAFQAVEEATGQTIATVVSWSAHVEALGDENVQLSADYAGFLCNYLERVLGGVGIFTVSEPGGLQTPLRGVFVPKMDADARFLGATGEVVATMGEAAAAPSGSRDKAAGLGRIIARTAVEALAAAEPTAVGTLRVQMRYAWIPLDNPFFYLGGRLGILPGLVDVLRGKRKSDYFVPSSRDASCGGVGCLRMDLLLVDLGALRIVTAPGELYPDYVVGRPASSIRYGGPRGEGYLDLDADGIPDADDPEIKVLAGTDDPETPEDERIYVTYRYPANPQKFMALTGLRPEDARRNGTRVLMVMSEVNNAIGYLIPESDHLNVFEGFLNGVDDYVSILGAADLRVMLDLKAPEEIILRDFIADVRARFAAILADIPNLSLNDHPNQAGDENSTGPRSGHIVYNTMCELLHGGTCPTRIPILPEAGATLPREP